MSDAILPHKFRGVLYPRMSTGHQEESVEQQLEWARQACPAAGIDVVATFTDEAKSGHATSKRTGFHRMLAFCLEESRAGRPIDVIVCWHSNRFSRADSQETGWYLWEFRKAGVGKMFTKARWFDFDRMEDRVLLGIEQDVSNHKYSVDLADAATRGQLAAARQGGWCGGPVPFGYRMRYRQDGRGRPEPDGLVPDPETAPVVRAMFEAYAAGQTSLRLILLDLLRRQVPPPRAARGTAWTAESVRRILTNEVYLGRLVWNRRARGKFFGVVDLQVTPAGPHRDVKLRRNDPSQVIRSPRDTHEALVDRDTFDRVQQLLAQNAFHTAPRPARNCYRASGLLYCGHCNRRMVGKRDPRTRKPLYVCGTYAESGKGGGLDGTCNRNSMSDGPLVGALVAKLQDRFAPTTLAHCRRMLQEEAGPDAPAEDLARIGRRVAELDGQLSRAARRMLTVEDESLVDVLRGEVKRLQAERAALAREGEQAARKQENAPDPAAVIDRAESMLADLPRLLERGTVAETRAILADHVEKVELWFTHFPHGTDTRSSFARGLIWLREDSPFVTLLSLTSGRSGQQGNGRTIELLPEDLAGIT